VSLTAVNALLSRYIVLISIINYAAPFNRSLTLTVEAHIRSPAGLCGISYGRIGTYKRFFWV